jgi:hypothetical protein
MHAFINNNIIEVLHKYIWHKELFMKELRLPFWTPTKSNLHLDSSPETVIREPALYIRCTFNPSPWLCQLFRNKLLSFVVRGVVSPTSNSQTGRPVLVVCPWLLIQCIRSCPLFYWHINPPEPSVFFLNVFRLSGQSWWLNIQVWKLLITSHIGLLLWSTGQRSWVRFPVLPDFLNSTGSGTGSTHPREDEWWATLKKKYWLQSRKLRLTAVGVPSRSPRDTPLSAKVGTKIRRSVAVAQSV